MSISVPHVSRDLTYPVPSVDRGPVATLWHTICPSCPVEALPCGSAQEGRMLAGLHDELHHRGIPTMRVRGSWPCAVCGGPGNRVHLVSAGVVVTCAGGCAEAARRSTR